MSKLAWRSSAWGIWGRSMPGCCAQVDGAELVAIVDPSPEARTLGERAVN